MKAPPRTRGPVTVLIAAGGTGGHVFPGIAVADALTALAGARVVFFGTPRGIESRVVPEHGYPVELLDVLPLKGVGPLRAALGALVAARATVKAAVRVFSVKPDAVLSVGGYAAGPVSLAAALLGVPVALLEPNSVPGFANRVMAPFAREVFVAWEEARAALRGRGALVGVPLRERFEPEPYTPTGRARVLVMGGSQGAAALNERLPLALGRVASRVPALEVVHQTGRGADEAVRGAYRREGVLGARVVPFLDDVASELAAADLVIARAGAVTLAEIAAVGRASILVPFPHAADDHQARNALALGRAGGALCIRQEAADATRLAREIEALLLDDRARVAMADAARARGRPHAAADIARALLDLAGAPAALGTARAAAKRQRGMNGAAPPGVLPSEVR